MGMARWPHLCVERLYVTEINAACTGGGVRVSKGTPQIALASVLSCAHQTLRGVHSSGPRVRVVLHIWAW